MYVGDFFKGQTVRFLWNSKNSSGASVTRTVNGTVAVYEDGGTTQFTTGVTDTEDFDGVTGVHLVAIDTSQSEYEPGKDYHVVLSGATIGGQTVNQHLFSFSIENRSGTKGQIIARGAAQGGSASTIQLAAGAVSADDEFNFYVVENVTTGEKRMVTATDDLTDTLTVHPEWRTAPQASDEYRVWLTPPFAVVDFPTVDAEGRVDVSKLLGTDLTAVAAQNWLTLFNSGGTTVGLLLGTLSQLIATIAANLEDRLPDELDSGRMKASVDALVGDTTAAQNLARSATAIILGAAVAGTLTTTQMTTSLAETTNNHYRNRSVIWTSGNLKGQSSKITAYSGITKLLTYEATTEAPAPGDEFVIV